MDAHQLEQLIEKTVLGQATQEDITYMMGFVDTEAAWALSMQLLSVANDQVRYFAANIIYTKVKKNWVQLGAEQQQEVRNRLWLAINIEQNGAEYIGASQGMRAFLGRVVLAYANASVRSPVTLRALLPECASMIQASASQPQQKQSLGSTALALDLLAALPMEVELLDVGRDIGRELRAILAESCDGVMSAVSGVVALDAAYSTAKEVVIGVLKVTRAWACAGLTITDLCIKYSAVLERTIVSALESGDPAATREACMALKECLASPDPQILGGPNPRVHAVKRTVGLLGDKWAAIASHFGPSGDDAVKAEVSNLLAFLGSAEAPQLCSVEGLEPNFFAALLFVVAQRPRQLAVLSFDVWLSIQDIPVSSRHPYATQDVFHQLLEVLLKQVTLSPNFTSWDVDGEDDEEDFAEFRSTKSGLQDVLLVCFYALDDVFFRQLGEFAGYTDVSWPRLEAVMFILQSVMSGLKANLSSQKSAAAIGFLTEALRRLLSRPPDNSSACHPALASTGCQFLSSATFILAKPSTSGMSMAEFLVPCLEYAFKAMWVPDAATSAAKAILQLSVHGAATLSSHPGVVEGLLGATVHLITSHDTTIPSCAIQTCVEAATRLTVSRDFAQASAAVTQLGMPLAHELEKACAHTIASAGQGRERVEQLMTWASQIIRFCDSAPVGPDGAHVLAVFLQGMWPLLQGSASSPLIMSSESVVLALFSVYSRAISSAEELVFPHISSIGEAIVTVFDTQGQALCLQCACAIVETLAEKSESDPTIARFLSDFLFRIAKTFDNKCLVGSPVANLRLWGFDPDGIEVVFRFFHNYIVHAPGIIVQSPALELLPQLAHRCLAACSERAPVRTILQCMQAFFYPVSPKLEPFHAAMLGVCVPLGPSFVQYLLASLGGRATSTLWPNLADTLFYLINGCGKSGQAGTDSIRAWLDAALATQGVMDAVADGGTAAQNLVATALIRLADSDRSRFKVLVQELTKVCGRETDISVLNEKYRGMR
jgi:transportin-3